MTCVDRDRTKPNVAKKRHSRTPANRDLNLDCRATIVQRAHTRYEMGFPVISLT